jgi:hypothetical protein
MLSSDHRDKPSSMAPSAAVDTERRYSKRSVPKARLSEWTAT